MTQSITGDFSSKASPQPKAPDKNDPMVTCCGPIEIAALMLAVIHLGLSIWDHIFGHEEAKAQPAVPAPAFGG